MNSNPLEQLRDMHVPVPDPAARLRARRAAMAEFRRIHGIEERKPAAKWSWKSPWLGGFATASVVVIGVSLAWYAPEEARELQGPEPAAVVMEAAPATATPALPEAASENPATGGNQGQAPVRVPRSAAEGIAAVAAPQSALDQVAAAPPAETSLQKSEAVTGAPAQSASRAQAASGGDFFIGNTIANLRGLDPAFGARTQTLSEDRLREAGDELSEVTVTGTRVQVPGNVAATNPISSITAEEMRQLGVVNVADALTQLVPQNISTYTPAMTGDNQAGAGGARAAARGGGPGGARAAQERNSLFTGNDPANLSGLDPSLGSRTLTLVDGRRMVSSSNQADVVDLNTIPSNLLQRMDVVTGGASATYGSAAAAGVVALVQPNGAPAAAVVLPQPEAATGQFEQFEINPVKRVADEPESTFSIDVDTASYSFARRILNQGRLPAMDAVRVEEMINYFDYNWPAPTSRQEPLRPTIAVSDSPWGQGKKLVHIGIKGYELPARGKPDANIVFLLDVSGSMNSPDRLPLAIQSMKLLLDSLKPGDTVGIVVYAGAAGQVLPPTPVRNRAAIERALDALRAGGSTAGAQGIQLAYQLAEQSYRAGGVNRIFLTTDGDFNVGITNRNELKGLVERERLKGINLSVLTFGQGNTRDDIAQTLAQNGNGVAAYIDTLQEARKVLVQEAGSSLFTIANDVKIQVEFNPATVAEYRLIGYETRKLNREDFNNDKVDAGEVGSGHRITAIYEITPVGSGAQLIDERRYTENARPASNAEGRSNEYGYLRIRYKLPGETQSKLMQQPIRQNAGVPAAVRQDVAFSTAVAGFGQLLRGGRYTGTLGYDDVIRQAESARGQDEFGYRAEFVQLVRKAREVGSPNCTGNSGLPGLNNLVNSYRQQLEQLQRQYTAQHPEVMAARAGLASAESSLAAETARLAALGVNCPAVDRD